MATIKSYTDIEQSKKLAEILPLDTADMCYANDGTAIKVDANSYNVRKSMWKGVQLIPCWSLTALLNIIQEPELIQNSEGTWLLRSWINTYPLSVRGYNDPIDACYRMVIRLHKLNLL